MAAVEAIQLEHMIMCQYLLAEFSLKAGADEGLTVEQADAVDRWRGKLRGIAIEEMLHIALVANLSSALGIAPSVDRPNIPQRSGCFPTGLQLDLLPFGEQALDHFLFLERPEGMDRHDATEFVATAAPRDAVSASETLPRGQEYATVGHLYRGIADGLRALAAQIGEKALFVGSPRAQATPPHLPPPISGRPRQPSHTPNDGPGRLCTSRPGPHIRTSTDLPREGSGQREACR